MKLFSVGLFEIHNLTLFWGVVAVLDLLVVSSILFSFVSFINFGRRKFEGYEWIVVGLVLSIAAMVLFRGAYSASNLEITDSVEYAIGAKRLFYNGSYSLVIDGQQLPPRYPIWFSALLGGPAHWFFGPDLGVISNLIFVLAILGCFAAYLLAREIGGVWGGCLAVGLLLVGPEFRQMNRIVWTDGVGASICLIIALIFVRSNSAAKRGDLIAATILACFIGLFRATNFLVLLPFVLVFIRKRLFSIECLIAMLLVGSCVALELQYNWSVFGSPFRTGYHFWMPAPYQFPDLLFNISNVAYSTAMIGKFGSLFQIILFGVAIWLLVRRLPEYEFQRNNIANLFFFGVVLLISLSLIFLPYRYARERFLIFATVIFAVLVASMLGMVLERRYGRYWVKIVTLSLGLAILLLCYPRMFAIPIRRLAADELNRLTPKDALLLTSLDPAYVNELVLKGTSRTALPLTRDIEYACKAYSWRSLPSLIARPDRASDLNTTYVTQFGGVLPVQRVAVESKKFISDSLESGRKVYLESSWLPEYRWAELNQDFKFMRLGQFVYSVQSIK